MKMDINDRLLKDIESLSTVTETYVLPTKGKLDDIPDRVTLRMMTTHEEKMRTGSRASYWKTMSEIINRCIVDPKGIDSYNLTVVDFVFLLYKLRIHSYGNMYKLNISRKCSECGTLISDVDVDLDKLKVTYIDDGGKSFSEPFTIKLPMLKWKVGCRMLRVRELDEIDKEVEDILQKYPDYEGDPALPRRLLRQIVTVDGEAIDYAVLEEIVDKLPAVDENAISKEFEKIDFGMDLAAKIKCPSCGKEYIVPLKYTDEFFRPSSVQV